jgi:hypothetical protein
MLIPDPGSEFFHPESRIPGVKIPDPDPHQRIYVLLTQKTVSKLSDNDLGCSFRIPDPDPDFVSWIRIPDPGVRKAPDPGSATLLTNILFGCTKCPCLRLWKKTVLNVELIS